MSPMSSSMASRICMLILTVTDASKNVDDPFTDVFSQMQESFIVQRKSKDISSQMNLIPGTQSDASNMKQIRFNEKPQEGSRQHPVEMVEIGQNYKSTLESPKTVASNSTISLPKKPKFGRIHHQTGTLKSNHLSRMARHIVLGVSGVIVFIMLMQNIIRLMLKRFDVPKVSLLQGLSLYFEFLTCVNATAVIPHSYFLVVSALGYNAVISGILISSQTPVGMISAYMAKRYSLNWDQDRNRHLVVISAFGLGTCTAVYAIGANPPSWLPFSTGVRFLILLLARICVGLFNNLPSLLRMMATKITPSKDLVNFNLYFTIVQGLGIGAGPFIATLGACTSSGKNDQLDAAITMWYVSALMISMGIALIFVLPREIDSLCILKEAVDAETRGVTTSVHSNNVVTPNMISNQKRVWLDSCLLTFMRCLISSGLEAGAGMVLEVYFLLDSSDTGIILGFTFIVGLPVCWMFSMAKEKGWGTAQMLLIVLLLIVVLATIFLFKELSTKWVFIYAIAVTFPAAFAANGFSNGLGFVHSLPGTFYSQENLMFLNTLVICAGRFIAPPISRALVTVGRDAFATLQLALALVACVTAIHLRRSANELDQQLKESEQNGPVKCIKDN